MKFGRIFSIALVVLTSSLFYQNCGTDFGNPTNTDTDIPPVGASTSVALKFNPYSQEVGLFNLIIPQANAETTNIKLCIKRIRLEVKSGTCTECEDLEFNVGEVNISSSGTSLGSLDIPTATYKEIRLRLDDDCSGNDSISFTNENGSFSTDDNVDLRFTGDLVVDDDTLSIDMGIDALVAALEGITSNEDISDAIENAVGDADESSTDD